MNLKTGIITIAVTLIASAGAVVVGNNPSEALNGYRNLCVLEDYEKDHRRWCAFITTHPNVIEPQTSAVKKPHRPHRTAIHKPATKTSAQARPPQRTPRAAPTARPQVVIARPRPQVIVAYVYPQAPQYAAAYATVPRYPFQTLPAAQPNPYGYAAVQQTQPYGLVGGWRRDVQAPDDGRGEVNKYVFSQYPR